MARPRPVPRPLVEKYGQEQFFLVCGRDAAAGVGDQQLDRIGRGGESAQQQVLDGGVAHGFGGVIDQVDDDALELFRIDLHGEQAGGELDAQVDAVEAAEEDGQGVLDDLVEVARHGLSGGEARELGELIGQRLYGFYFAGNGAGAFAKDALGVRGDAAAIQNARDALGAEGDRRQRILEFMSDTAGDFVPGRGFLRAQQFAGVFEHNHETLAGGWLRGEGGNRNGQMQDLRGRVHVHLAGGDAGAAGALHQVLDFDGVFARKQIAQVRGALDLLLREQALQGAIHALDAAVGAHGKHAGGDAFENGFGETAAAFELAAVGF